VYVAPGRGHNDSGTADHLTVRGEVNGPVRESLAAHQVIAYARLTDLDIELTRLPVNARCDRGGDVRAAHPADQRAHFC
jgi:hypothetical protein